MPLLYIVAPNFWGFEISEEVRYKVKIFYEKHCTLTGSDNKH